MKSRILLALGLAWSVSACTTTTPTRTDDVKLATTPDQDALHELVAPLPQGDDEDRAVARAARLARINELETLYDTSTNDIVRSNTLFELAQLHHERAFDLKDQAAAAHATELDRFLIGEIAAPPTIRLDAYRSALLQRVNVLRDLAGNYPKDPRLAEVNWQLASTLARLGNDHCEQYFKQAAHLAKTPAWANRVKLSRADWLASNKKWDDAIKIYTEVRAAITDKTDTVRAYATYRLGWAQLEKGDKTKAAAAFRLAILGVTADEPHRFALRREAERSLAALWAATGSESEAKAFAEAQGLTTFMRDYHEHVVAEWQKQDKVDQLIAHDRDAIAKDPTAARLADYRLRIAQAHVAKGNVAGLQEEIAALTKMATDTSDPWYDEHGDDEAKVTRVKKIVTLLPLAASLKIFQQALAEKDVKKQKPLMTTAIKALDEQKKTVTDPQQSLAVRMSIIQGLIVLEKFPEALDELDALVKLGPKAEPHLIDAAFERLKILVKLDGEQVYAAVPEPGEVKNPIPLPALKQRFAVAAEEYLKLVPDAENKVNLKYQIAQDLFTYGHYDQALPLLEAVAVEFPRTEQGKAGIEICLSMNLKKKNYQEIIRLATSLLNNRQVKGKVLRDYIKENLDWAKQQTGVTAH